LATNSTPSRGKVAITLILLFDFIAASLLGLLLPTSSRLWVWIGTLILLALFMLAVGYGFTGWWLGVLIDNRRKMSLSRFQAVLWTLLILSAFLAAALTNIPLVNNPTDALSIRIPPELLAILGISVISLAGASLILNNKKPELVDRNSASADPSDRPSWVDMFKGDDVANADYLDLSKVQMFCFTLVLVLVYSVALASMFMVIDPRHPAINAFPTPNITLVWLLGISHAGYLIYKAIPRVPLGVSQRAPERESYSSLSTVVDPLMLAYENDLNQARQSSLGSAIAATLGLLIIATGVITILTGNTTIGLITSVAGIIIEFGVALSLRQVRKAYALVDKTRATFLEAERIKQALSMGDETLKEEILSRTLNLPN
jgi:hypothetical protein